MKYEASQRGRILWDVPISLFESVRTNNIFANCNSDRLGARAQPRDSSLAAGRAGLHHGAGGPPLNGVF